MIRLSAPPLTPSGSYEPVALFEFLSRCRKGSIPPQEIADCLNVTLDLAEYAIGPGYHMFKKRAIRALGLPE
tara:strand:- start:334 stop:549 length:216 start_codon:yes stop_codon:yes gene_type:complete